MTETAIRPYRAGDETALVDLFYRSFGHRITEDHWRWKLRGRPSLKWVFAAAGFFWLIFMFGLGSIDYATRSGFPPH